MRKMFPVDVISLCDAEGEIKPLRMRMDGGGQPLRVDICEITESTDIQYVGSEARVFHCRAQIGHITCNFELQYAFRSHRWWLLESELFPL